MSRLERVIFLLILTMFFAYLVAPLLRFAEQPMRFAGTERRLPRGMTIGIIYLFIVGVACTGAGMLLPKVTQQISDAVSHAPVYAVSLRAIRQSIDRTLLGAGDAAIEYARRSLMALVGTLSYLPWLVLIPILAFFRLPPLAGMAERRRNC